LVEMKETAKAQVSKNKNELLAARKLEVSLDRADNVIEGGTPFHTTQTYAVEFPGGPSFAPLFHAKGGGLDAPPATTTANCTPSFLHLTLVSISTNIQRLENVLAWVGTLFGAAEDATWRLGRGRGACLAGCADARLATVSAAAGSRRPRCRALSRA
jgi:hypothetical protein